MKVLGVVAATGDLNPLLGVIEIGQARVVELEVGTAELAQTADLLGIGGAEVAPELLDVGVDVTVDRSRPLCPYPQVAKYKGSGSIDEASSFVCAAP